MAKHLRQLIWLTTLLALAVIVLGAYVRLSDAGLGCPDWPGCYGHLGVPVSPEQIQKAKVLYPDQTIEHPKAAKEMLHRYLAGGLGLLILLINILALKTVSPARPPMAVTLGLLVLVIFQALLGMWTVTLLLKPVIVTAHLLGGMAILVLLVWLSLSVYAPRSRVANSSALSRLSTLGLLVVFLQVALGGWVSSNYAALACSDFPLCQGRWWPPMDFSHAFHLTRELGKAADGGSLGREALTALHWTHRVGALVTVVVVGALVWRAARYSLLRNTAFLVLGLLLTQVALGIANVWLSLPLSVALLHNAGAALLLCALTMLKFKAGSIASRPKS